MIRRVFIYLLLFVCSFSALYPTVQSAICWDLKEPRCAVMSLGDWHETSTTGKEHFLVFKRHVMQWAQEKRSTCIIVEKPVICDSNYLNRDKIDLISAVGALAAAFDGSSCSVTFQLSDARPDSIVALVEPFMQTIRSKKDVFEQVSMYVPHYTKTVAEFSDEIQHIIHSLALKLVELPEYAWYLNPRIAELKKQFSAFKMRFFPGKESKDVIGINAAFFAVGNEIRMRDKKVLVPLYRALRDFHVQLADIQFMIDAASAMKKNNRVILITGNNHAKALDDFLRNCAPENRECRIMRGQFNDDQAKAPSISADQLDEMLQKIAYKEDEMSQPRESFFDLFKSLWKPRNRSFIIGTAIIATVVVTLWILRHHRAPAHA